MMKPSDTFQPASDASKPPSVPPAVPPSVARKPRIMLLGTGGTIAGHAESAFSTSAYDCSVLPIDDILAALPPVGSMADIVAEQVFQLGSENFGSVELLALGQRIAALLRRDDIDGVVVTHGTDTLEETAFFLHLTLPSEKPVVIVGAMRPPSSLSADGPLNLFNGIVVASCPSSRGKGTLVVMNDEIHTARDVSKVSTSKLEAFRSPFGPLGYVVEGQALYYRLLARRHTLRSQWRVDQIDCLAKVGMIYAHNGSDPQMIEAVLQSTVQAIVYAGTGNGNIAASLIPILVDARQRGIRIVRASRTGSGVVVRNAAQPDDAYGWVVAADHLPQKARILTMLALACPRDAADIAPPIHDADRPRHCAIVDHSDAALQRAFFDY